MARLGKHTGCGLDTTRTAIVQTLIVFGIVPIVAFFPLIDHTVPTARQRAVTATGVGRDVGVASALIAGFFAAIAAHRFHIHWCSTGVAVIAVVAGFAELWENLINKYKAITTTRQLTGIGAVVRAGVIAIIAGFLALIALA